MTIKINGSAVTLQPTEHGWIPKTQLGIQGSGQGFYAPVQEYEMRWQLISASDLNQLMTFFGTISTTGTAVLELPQYGGATYTFVEYSGAVLDEPQVSAYFEQHTTNVVLLVRNIRV